MRCQHTPWDGHVGLEDGRPKVLHIVFVAVQSLLEAHKVIVPDTGDVAVGLVFTGQMAAPHTPSYEQECYAGKEHSTHPLVSCSSGDRVKKCSCLLSSLWDSEGCPVSA